MIALVASFAAIWGGALASRGMMMWDESEYATCAREILRGHGLRIYGQPDILRPPVMPLAVAASFVVTRSRTDVAARLPSLAFALAGLVVTAWATRRAFGDATGLAAAALLALMPLYGDLATLALAEAAFATLFTAAFWQLYAALDGRLRAWIASAVLAALALLTRYTGLMFLPVAVATIAIAALARQPGATVRTLRSPVPWLGLLAAAAVLAPWFVREARLTGDPFAGIRLAAGLVPRWTSMPWHFYLSTLPATVTWPVVVLMLLGVVVVARERPAAGTVCLLAAACVIAWHSRYPYKEERFIGAALPFLATVGHSG